MSILIIHTHNLSRRKHFAHVQEYARHRGERCLIVMEEPTWESTYFDRAMSAPTANIELTIKAVRELAADEEEPIRAVLTFVEHSVPVAAAVAADLGLPFISQTAAILARDKYAMRQAFARKQMRQPSFAVASNAAEGRRAASRIGYPLVMKPLIGGGSMYVRRLDRPEDFDEFFEPLRADAWADLTYDPIYASTHERYNGGVLLEGFLPGGEVSVESIVDDGNTHVLAIHDKPLPLDGPYFEEYFYSTPTQLDPATIEKITEATAAAHQALDINIGATHTEFRLVDGEPVILETAARLGGGPLYQSVRLTTGVDMVQAMLDLAYGDRPNLTGVPTVNFAGFCQFFSEKAGRVQEIMGVSEAQAHPHVDELDIYCTVGDEVNVPPFVFQANGHGLFSAGTYKELAEVFFWLQRTVKFRVA